MAFLLFNFSSVSLVLKLLQWQAKYEMAQKLDRNQKTELLSFHKKHFRQQLQHGDEFDWNNKRYDVVKAIYSADSVNIIAVDDTREKSILNYLCKLVFKQNKQGKNPSKINNLCLLIFQAPLPDIIAISTPVKEHVCTYYFEVQRTYKVYHQILAPPPKLA